ncbi:hypothetical protein [Aureimonas sp. SK2]|uniref:hypothetical protein n=1 Tax=Aureimonas sp. SK2 TaxID=3015992 RepID=UPI0024450AF8|nr:hypothetical protein [Aureimonas sp. SK2]
MTGIAEITPYRYRILCRVRAYSLAGRNQISGWSPFMAAAYDWLEQRGLIENRPVERLAKFGIVSSEYATTASGEDAIKAIRADGRIDRTLAQQDRIRQFLERFGEYTVTCSKGDVPSIDVRIRGGRMDTFYAPRSARLRYDEDAYAEAGRLLGSNVVRIWKDVDVLALRDDASVLPGGEVLHRVQGIEHCWRRPLRRQDPAVTTIFLIRSIVDDVWISAPTERAVKLRLKKHVPVETAPTSPAPRTAEDDIDDAALADGF